MNHGIRILICLFAACCLPGLGLAQGPSYNYVEVGVTQIDIDTTGIDDEADGWLAAVQFGGKMWHFLGEYRSNELDTAGSGPEETTWWAGVGWHGLLGEKGDVVVDVAYVDTELKNPRLDDSGWRGSAGVRFLVIKLLEVNGFYNYVDFDDELIRKSYSGGEVNAIVNLGRLGIGLGYERIDKDNQYVGFVRFNFGKQG